MGKIQTAQADPTPLLQEYGLDRGPFQVASVGFSWLRLALWPAVTHVEAPRLSDPCHLSLSLCRLKPCQNPAPSMRF